MKADIQHSMRIEDWTPETELELQIADKPHALRERLAVLPPGAFRLDDSIRGNIAWVALGVLHWQARGLRGTRRIAAELNATVGEVRRAKFHITRLKTKSARASAARARSIPQEVDREEEDADSEYEETDFAEEQVELRLSDEETHRLLKAAGFDPSRLRGDGNAVQRALEVLWCEQKGLGDAVEIAKVLGITKRAVRRAMNDLKFAAQKTG